MFTYVNAAVKTSQYHDYDTSKYYFFGTMLQESNFKRDINSEQWTLSCQTHLAVENTQRNT